MLITGGHGGWKSAPPTPILVNPARIDDMTNLSIDMSAEILTTLSPRGQGIVTTMGCGDSYPIFPGKRYEDWELADPAGQGVAAVRPIRDEIKGRIEDLTTSLTATTK